MQDPSLRKYTNTHLATKVVSECRQTQTLTVIERHRITSWNSQSFRDAQQKSKFEAFHVLRLLILIYV